MKFFSWRRVIESNKIAVNKKLELVDYLSFRGPNSFFAFHPVSTSKYNTTKRMRIKKCCCHKNENCKTLAYIVNQETQISWENQLLNGRNGCKNIRLQQGQKPKFLLHICEFLSTVQLVIYQWPPHNKNLACHPQHYQT